jgi:hypothetical protein
MDRRFIIADAARAEVTELRGELAAISVYALADRRRGWGWGCYTPVGGGTAEVFFDDQIEECR